MAASKLNCQTLANPLPTRRTHATVQDVTDDDSYEIDNQSSVESTSTTESRRNSFFENYVIEEELVAQASRLFPHRPSTVPTMSEVGQRINQLTLPKNFAQVRLDVYRSAYPDPENFSFLRVLGLKSILTLVPEEYSERHQQFLADNHIQHFQIGIEPNKSPFLTINAFNMTAALCAVLDRKNYPMLIHCNKGKHRTGCVVACMRKILGWKLEDIIAEYRKYAGAKARVLDERYIELFDEQALQWIVHREQLVPPVSVPEPYVKSRHAALSSSTRLRS